jgi:lipoyl(octanoyl) transferase
MTVVDSIVVKRLGRADYLPTWTAMREFTQKRGEDAADELWLLEHPPVYTLGQGAEHPELGNGVPLLKVDRGGDITYHGPGQLVCYPILDLTRHGEDVKRYCRDLEEALIRTIGAVGIEATRIEGLTGIWLERPPRKVASIGVHISKWVTTHGYALNVDLDPAPFTEWITAW